MSLVRKILPSPNRSLASDLKYSKGRRRSDGAPVKGQERFGFSPIVMPPLTTTLIIQGFVQNANDIQSTML
jgi:hypothetical protein